MRRNNNFLVRLSKSCQYKQQIIFTRTHIYSCNNTLICQQNYVFLYRNCIKIDLLAITDLCNLIINQELQDTCPCFLDPNITYPTSSYPTLPLLILSYSTLSYHLSYLTLSYPIIPYPILSPTISHPILSHPTLFYHILPYIILSYLTLSHAFLTQTLKK